MRGSRMPFGAGVYGDGPFSYSWIGRILVMRRPSRRRGIRAQSAAGISSRARTDRVTR